MRDFLQSINASPRYVGVLGTIASWFTVERLQAAVQQALPFAQLVAILLAGFVSLCSAILIAPKAIAMVKTWLARERQRNLFDE